MPFHDFGHQTVQRPTASSHQLQDSGAFLLGFERSLDGVRPAHESFEPCQKFFFVFGCVSHGALYYNPV